MPLWYFWLADDGQARRIATARFHRVLEGKDRILEFAGRTVDIVELVMQCEDRQPVRALSARGYRYTFLTDGALDKDRHWEGLRLALGSMETSVDRRSRVRDIGPRLSKKRWNREFRFELTDGHYEALRRAI